MHHTRAFVKIQEGCNDFCSYCIIPKTRGASRTLDADGIIAEIRDREAEGYSEVVLTGTQLGDFGIGAPGSRRAGPDRRDQETEGNPLAGLLVRILAATSVPRIRLSSLQPQDVTAGLVALWSNPRLCPHFHLPLQSGSRDVLASMRRRYTPEEFIGAVGRLRESLPHVAITTDVIVGYPGETEEDFEATLAVSREAAFADMHLFPYSERPGTLAARLPGRVADPVKQERMRRGLDLAEVSRRQYQRRFVGTEREVLWEERKQGDPAHEAGWSGLTDNYLRTVADSPDDLSGRVTRARLIEALAGVLRAEVLR